MAKNRKTRDQSKTVLRGLIDVSWRKTSMLETEARKLLDDEKVLFRKEEKGGRGRQKKETITENMERMAAAHQAVEELDLKVKNIQDSFKAAKTVALREQNSKKYVKEKLLLDGAYTELKRAQDAITKSIKVKRKEIDDRLRARSDNDHEEVTILE